MSRKCQQRSFGFQATRIPVAARQGDGELGECAGLGLDIDPSAMLLDDDVIELIERPSPVPSAGRLQSVKKGLNIFSLTSGAMPVPSSRPDRTSTVSPRFLVAAESAGSKALSLFSALRLVAA